MLVDVNHRQTRSVLRTGRLPPAPKPPEFFTRLLEELAHRAGSVENLRKIVEEHKDSATQAVRKRKNEICNKLPEDAAATGPAPQTAAPAEGTAPAAQAASGDATKAPGDNAGTQEPATDADPPVPETGPDEPLA
jgi:hypothetical protein